MTKSMIESIKKDIAHCKKMIAGLKAGKGGSARKILTSRFQERLDELQGWLATERERGN